MKLEGAKQHDSDLPYVFINVCFIWLIKNISNPCGWKVRLQCIAVRKECALQTHSRILQHTPMHSHIFFFWKVRTPNALPGLHLQTKIHALQTHSWNFVFSKKIMHSICTPET